MLALAAVQRKKKKAKNEERKRDHLGYSQMAGNTNGRSTVDKRFMHQTKRYFFCSQNYT